MTSAGDVELTVPVPSEPHSGPGTAWGTSGRPDTATTAQAHRKEATMSDDTGEVEVRVEWGVRRKDGKERLWTCDGQAEASEWVTGHNADVSKPRLQVVRRTVSTSPWEEA